MRSFLCFHFTLLARLTFQLYQQSLICSASCLEHLLIIQHGANFKEVAETEKEEKEEKEEPENEVEDQVHIKV